MQIPILEPDDLLMKGWPTSNFEGLVFDIQKDGTLRLGSYGSVRGPLYFRRAPRKPARQLIEASMQDYDVASYAVLQQEAPARFNEILAVALHPKVPLDVREWAVLSLPNRLTPEQANRLIPLVRSFPDPKLTQEQRRRLSSMVASQLLWYPTPETFDAVVRLRGLGTVGDHFVIRSIEDQRMTNQSALLDHFLGSARPETLSAAVRVSGKVGYKGALPRARELTAHESARVRISAWGAVVRLTDDVQEKQVAMKSLQRLWDQALYQNSEIIDAWRDSGSREALGYLVWALETGKDTYDRRNAASALGEFGRPEAVPALLNAKVGKTPDLGTPRTRQETMAALLKALGQALEDADVKKAAIEALWMFDRRKHRSRRVPMDALCIACAPGSERW